MVMVAAQYGMQVETEVLNDRVGRAPGEAVAENNLRVAGAEDEAKTAEGKTMPWRSMRPLRSIDAGCWRSVRA